MRPLIAILLLLSTALGQTLTGHAAYSGKVVAGNVSGGGSGASTKARSFNGSSDNLQSASSLTLGSPTVITLAFRMYWTTFANDDKLAFESSANFNSVTGAILVDPDESGTGEFYFAVQTVGAGGGKFACHFARPSGAAWHAYLLVLNIAGPSGDCAAYVDGVSQSPTVAAEGGYVSTSFTNQTLNVMSRNAASLFGAGRISDITIWAADESANASTLNSCATDPSTVDAANQKYYWPIKQVSPETPTTGAVNLTVTGTTNIASPC